MKHVTYKEKLVLYCIAKRYVLSQADPYKDGAFLYLLVYQLFKYIETLEFIHILTIHLMLGIF